MKNSESSIDIKSLSTQLKHLLRRLGAYKGFLFFLATAALYSFILFRLNTYSNAPASNKENQAVTQAHIDSATITKIKNLQDNSVSVQTLFDTARDNPFQE